MPVLVKERNDNEVFINSLGMEFVLLPAGFFFMGSNPILDMWAAQDEMPYHRVTITHSFYMSRYPVTQEQWMEVAGRNPSIFRGKNLPVENVSWMDAVGFAELLNKKEDIHLYRLPTEAEWEYAVRSGTMNPYFFGEDFTELSSYAWYDGNSEKKTHPVGLKQPNPWGLFDMCGNVGEWVWDWYSRDYYSSAQEINPSGPPKGLSRVCRGLSWAHFAADSRSAARGFSYVGRSSSIGFRLVISPIAP